MANVQLTVLSGGTAEPALDVVADAFNKATGHTVKVLYNLGAKGRKRMDDGEIFDVLVQSANTLDQFFRPGGKIEPGGVRIGRAGLGVLIRPGAPVPDITTVAMLKQALLNADTVLYTLETSGRHIEGMLRKVGVFDQIVAKTERFPHGPELMTRALQGAGRELGFLSMNAIRTFSHRGLVLVGPLPEEVQFYYDFTVVPASNSPHKDVAWQFAHFCGNEGKPLLAAHGIS